MSGPEPLRARLQQVLSGQPRGVPEWIQELEHGDDAGHFGPGSAVWAVHGGMPTLAAGVRALLMQALHPGALAGVWDHSRFREDPLGRLANTIRWIFTVTYGSRAQAEGASAFVRRIHRHVVGEYVDGRGVRRPYAANDPDLATWVHLAFTDAFLEAHRAWGGPIPGGPDEYVREWAVAGRLMHVPAPPESVAALKDALRSYAEAGLLRRDERTSEVVAFLRDAPLPASLRPAYRLLFAGAVGTLERPYRDLLGLTAPRVAGVAMPVRRAASAALGAATLLLGDESAGERVARARIARLERSAVPVSDPA